MNKTSLLGALVAASVVGCTSTSVSAPRVPVPVLLGPVDRVGGHRGEGAVRDSISVEIEHSYASSSNRTQVGNTTYVTQTVSEFREGGGAFSTQILESTNAQHDADVRIEKIGTGAWLLLFVGASGGGVAMDEWVDVDAKVTKEQPR